MSNVVEYKDLIAFHPGYYLADTIEEMNFSQAEFARRLGTNTKTVSFLLNGQANITNDLAKKLSVMLGTSETVWLNLQSAFDQKVIEIQKAKDFDQQIETMKMIDYRYFMEFLGLPATRIAKEKVENLCSYFKIADLRIMLEPDFLVNYRVGIPTVSEKNMINSRAWLQAAINISQQLNTAPYDEKKLKSYLFELRSMTVQEPDQFYPRMRQVFSECGVAFVMLPNLKNSGINGAVKWISNDKVVLAMNDRRMYADVFWFALFHEIRHVLQKKTKTTFISSSDEEMIEINRKLEDDADQFASDFLIPPGDLKKFAPSKFTSDDDIVAFAKSIGIHPGIVAGRLQHEGIIAPNRCAGLKKKYHFTWVKPA